MKSRKAGPQVSVVIPTHNSASTASVIDMGISCCLAGEMRRSRRAFLDSIALDPRAIWRYAHLTLSLMGRRVYDLAARSRKWS